MKKIYLLALGTAAVLCGCSGDDDDDDDQNSPQTVQTEAGPVAGVVGDITVFKGIPYARPPVADLRWKPPQPPLKWDGVKETTAFGPACMQSGNAVKSEDCLTLNIWAQADAIKSKKNLPVLVWVYGGSFTGGSGNIDGTALAQDGVIVVSMNYRVSTFGFMAHPELTNESPNKTSGNYGLLDIAASLRWVKDNIQNFGGDPKRVSLWGQSSGASAITALMVSPQANGLFQQVILDSPGAMRHWKTLATAEQDGVAVGASIAALRALPAEQVPLIANLGGGTQIRELASPRVIGPTLDGYILPREERPTFEAGLMNPVPTLIGYNTDEGASFTGNYTITTISGYKDYLNNPVIFGAFGDEALTVYPVTEDSQVKRAISDSFGDNQFVFGTRGIARAMAAKGVPVYRYWFKRKADGGTGHDSQHGDELPYVRGDAALANAPFNADDRALSAAMKGAWIKFVTTANPNGAIINNWPIYDAATEPVFTLDATFGIVNAPRTTELDFIGKVDAALNPR